MARILITGGAGFIGSHLARSLTGGDHQVSVIDDLSGGSRNNLDMKRVAFYEADCRDAEKMSGLIDAIKPEIVFHLAANAAENLAQFSPVEITSRNYSAFINVLAPFIRNKGKRFIFTSSIAVYGALQIPFKETDTPEPEDLYGVTKLAAEKTLEIMSKVHEFEYVIARPHNVYGPFQNMTDPYRNVVTIWMNAIMAGKSYFIYGDGEQRRCFSYVDDVVEALAQTAFAQVSGMIFNIGADRHYSLNELHEALKQLTFGKAKATYLPDRPQEVKQAVSDHTQSKKYLGYQDITPLKAGLKRTWEWAMEQGVQNPVYKKIEIPSSKIPANWVAKL